MALGQAKRMMIDTRPTTISAIGEKDLRYQIDRSVSRAMFDGDYARLLLADPTVVLEDYGCTPQQLKSLCSISASSLFDFAQQARALFWADEPTYQTDHQEDLPLAAAASQ
jgi:hypothetical protein